MKTRKLKYRNSKSKKRIRKSSRRIKFTKSKRSKLTGGGLYESSTEPQKRKIRMETKVLGKVPAGPTSNIKLSTPKELDNYVDTQITEGPQICTIPAPPYRHAFLVDVQPDKIMISDWGGEAVRDITHRMMSQPDDEMSSQSTYYNETYKTYADFLEKLQEKYERPIEFYPVDEEMNTCSRAVHKERGGTGGCSDYIYKWAKKYYPGYIV